MTQKAIIVAAGRGRRLESNTDEVPKCLVDVGGRSILAHQTQAFAACGVRRFVIVRGYLGHVIADRQADWLPSGCTVEYVNNPDYASNNILQSLFFAQAELRGGAVITYSDIVFTVQVVERLLSTAADIALVIDRDFARVYEGRDDHPLSEAEVADLDDTGCVRRVGKRALPPQEAWGEFIGLSRLSAEGAGRVLTTWAQLGEQFRGGHDQPFMRARTFKNAYLTDLWQYLIDAGVVLTPAEIHGGWREIDTVQDLHRARALLGCGQEDWK